MQSSQQKLIQCFAQIVKLHRKKVKKSVYKIAAESALDNSTWRKIENLQCADVKLSTIWKIAEGLDMYPDELIKELRLKLGDDFSLIDD